MTTLEKELLSRIEKLEEQIRSMGRAEDRMRELSGGEADRNKIETYGPPDYHIKEITYQLKNYRILAIGFIGTDGIPNGKQHSKMDKAFSLGRKIVGEKKVEDILFWL